MTTRSTAAARVLPTGLELDAGASRAETVAALKAHLAQLAPARPQHTGLPTGHPQLDAQTGGWPTPGLSEIVGKPGLGRMALVLPALKAAMDAGHTVAIVDANGWLHPPGLDGLPLNQLLIVRPAARALWATEQLARSAAMPLVVLLDPPPLGRGARRLSAAAEAGDCAVLVLTESADRHVKPTVRLIADGHRRFRITRGGRRPDAVVVV